MFVILQNDTVLQTAVNNDLNQLTFYGVIITIVLTVLSLRLQLESSARESLEQLDDVHINKKQAKLLPLLHKYSWLKYRVVVKLKAYKPTEVAGMSNMHPRSLLLSCRGFQDYNIEPVADGYELTVKSIRPVKIRRKTTQLLEAISGETTSRSDYEWVKFEQIEEHYGDAIRDGEGSIHKEIRRVLEESGCYTKKNCIEDEIGLSGDSQSKIVGVALEDLIKWDEVEAENGEYRIKGD